MSHVYYFFFFQAEDGIRDDLVTGVQTCALPICDFSAQLFHHATASVVSRIGGKGESSAAQIARSNSASASVSLSSAIAAATQPVMNRGFFSGARSFSSLRAPSTATMFTSEGERSTPPATPRAAIPSLNAAIPPPPA